MMDTITSNKWVYRVFCVVTAAPTAIVAIVLFFAAFVYPDIIPYEEKDVVYEFLRLGALCAFGGILIGVLLGVTF